MPKVSIVIPTYNRAALIGETIESVLSQTYRDFEIIVVDDGSTDDTQSVLAPMVAEGLIGYVYQENRGESAARNHGVRLASGVYIAFLDSDDLFEPQKLAKQVAILDANPDLGLVHSDFARFDHVTGTDLGYRSTAHLVGWVYPEILTQWSVLIATPTVMLRADVLKQVGGFDESMHWAEDIDLWRRVARLTPLGAVPEALTRVRTHEGSLAGDRSQSFPAFQACLQKAFAEDPNLSKRFKRRAWANLYANAGHNLLGEGSSMQMKQVRHYSLLAIRYQPLNLSAYLGLLGSFLSPKVRQYLLKKWRARKYRPA